MSETLEQPSPMKPSVSITTGGTLTTTDRLVRYAGVMGLQQHPMYRDDQLGRERFPLWYRQHCLVRDGRSIQHPAGWHS